MMRVIAFDKLEAFAGRVTPLLLEREAENCFLLGRIAELSRRAGGRIRPMTVRTRRGRSKPRTAVSSRPR